LPNYRGLDVQFVRFGPEVTSDNLFCEKEQPLFDFYERSKDRYKKALDIGANIGIHSILMAKQGWEVRALEPDRLHYTQMLRNIDFNHVGSKIVTSCAAVSDEAGRGKFVRLLANTTGSHLAGDKDPYGDKEEFTVEIADVKPLFEWADFAKLDCEGAEARLIQTLKEGHHVEIMAEVGNAFNASAIFAHCRRIKSRMWAQKLDWKEVKFFLDMPNHHSQGALFIGKEAPF
jgi:FkbM family methyltransferase